MIPYKVTKSIFPPQLLNGDKENHRKLTKLIQDTESLEVFWFPYNSIFDTIGEDMVDEAAHVKKDIKDGIKHLLHGDLRHVKKDMVDGVKHAEKFVEDIVPLIEDTVKVVKGAEDVIKQVKDDVDHGRDITQDVIGGLGGIISDALKLTLTRALANWDPWHDDLWTREINPTTDAITHKYVRGASLSVVSEHEHTP